jgi:hypothetical protein
MVWQDAALLVFQCTCKVDGFSPLILGSNRSETVFPLNSELLQVGLDRNYG